jgi:hypothetical protein
MKRFACVLWLTALGAGCVAGSDAGDPNTVGVQPIVRGTAESGFPQVVLLRAVLQNGGWIGCSGTYIGPRLVVTAAHCVRPGLLAPNGIYVYYGTDYETDLAQLPNIPPPGQPSVWAQSDSWERHPDYQASVNYPDLAVVYLDRELPFDPMPLFPGPVNKPWIGTQAEVVGWGGSKALTADISQVEGFGVKRSGFETIVGSPTAADYHADDPNPGILDPAIRANLIKLDGAAPNSNTCAGDSGGPMFITTNHTTYQAGVGFWTGLYCEDYAIFTRLDPFRGFLHDALQKAGQLAVVPRLECVEHRSDGAVEAYFDYRNDNGVSLTIPYGKNTNELALDTADARPTTFLPGDHRWALGLPFSADQKVVYKLSSPHGKTTVLHVDAQSAPACVPGLELACVHSCQAQLAVDCDFEALPSLESCVAGCVANADFFPPTCSDEWAAYNECVGRLSPSDPNNWVCYPGYPPAFPSGYVCTDEVSTLIDCINSGG